MPDKPQRQPHPHTLPTYGATIRYAKHINQSPPTTKEQQKYIQQVIGVLLYYGRAVDSTLLVALSSLASAQAAPTEHTMELIKWLLDYAATNPDAILTYKSSDMILAVHSDASYLSEANHFFCSSDVSEQPTTEPSSTFPKYSRQSCPVRPKPNWEHCTSMQAKQSQCAHSSQKWATNNPRLPIKQTIQLRAGSSTTTSNHDTPKPWTCAFSLASLSRLPRTIQLLLGSRNQQPSQLLDQTPLRRSPHREEARNLNFKIHTQRSQSINPTNTSYFRQRPHQDQHGRRNSLIHTLHNRGTERVC
jgi:hypothetical protein